MPYPAFTGGVANIKPAAFFAVYIKTGSEKWQTLGAISNGVLNVKDFAAPDSLTRNLAINSYSFTATCRMMQSSTTELELLDSICDGSNSFLFKLSDAGSPAGSATSGWVAVTNSQVGVKAKLVADGSPDANRYIELSWQGTIYKSDSNEVALYTPTLAAADFEATGSGGTYHGIGTYTAATDGGNPTLANIKSCGISTFTLDLAGGSSPVTIAPVTNVKMTFDMLPFEDGLKRFLPKVMDVVLDIDCMATLPADLLLQGNMSVVAVKLIATFLDGLVVTLDNQTGIEIDFEVSGDMDKPRILRFTHKGKTLQATIGTIAA